MHETKRFYITTAISYPNGAPHIRSEEHTV